MSFFKQLLLFQAKKEAAEKKKKEEEEAKAKADKVCHKSFCCLSTKKHHCFVVGKERSRRES
jgi:hypothetical protein